MVNEFINLLIYLIFMFKIGRIYPKYIEDFMSYCKEIIKQFPKN